MPRENENGKGEYEEKGHWDKMKYLLKKHVVSILICSLLILGMTGCGKATLDNTVSDTNGKKTEQEADAWMEQEKESAKKTSADETEEEFLDIDSVGDDETDYSKYENKKAQRAADGSENDDVTYSDGSESGQGEFQTDPIPEGMQNPVDSGEVDTSQEQYCYMTISCATILNNMEALTPGKETVVPPDGIIYTGEVSFNQGETVFDILLRETQNYRIHMEYSFNPMFNSNYIEAINNLYEFDCGNESGWMYNVNGWYPNYGCSRYVVQEGDEIQWNYTCDLGRDLGTNWYDQNE